MNREIINTDKELTPATLEAIRERLATELLKRGFTAPIAVYAKTVRAGQLRIGVDGEPFITTPVLFKEIRVANFGGSLGLDKETGDLKAWIPVHVSYEHFTGGSNGLELFTAVLTISQHQEDVYRMEIR